MDWNEAIKSHAEWKMKLRMAITTRSPLDADTIARDDCCVLGKWLHGESKVKFASVPAYSECIRRHAIFHREAGKIASTINLHNYAEAEQMLAANTPYSDASNAVVVAIGAMKRIKNV